MTSAAFIFMRVIGALRCGLSAGLCGDLCGEKTPCSKLSFDEFLGRRCEGGRTAACFLCSFSPAPDGCCVTLLLQSFSPQAWGRDMNTKGN